MPVDIDIAKVAKLARLDLTPEELDRYGAQLGDILPFFGSVGFLHPDRTRWTIELLRTLLRACVTVEMRLKHSMACRRPIEYSAQIQPTILTPGHGTFPSGHATEAFMVAHVLSHLMQEQEQRSYGAGSGEQRPWRDPGSADRPPAVELGTH